MLFQDIEEESKYQLTDARLKEIVKWDDLDNREASSLSIWYTNSRSSLRQIYCYNKKN